MKRGTATERGLALVGASLWVAWAILNASLFAIAFGVVGLVMSVYEYRRWQRRERMGGSGFRAGQDVYPRWAWFAVGAVPAVLIAGFVYGIVEALAGRTVPNDVPDALSATAIAAWVVGGLAAERLLVRAARRREAAGRASAVPLPPPPPGLPPIPADPARPSARREVPTIGRPGRRDDPRARF